MSFQVWLLFAMTDTVLCFTPGPAVLLVISVALGRGFREGVQASLGILAANALYFAFSAAGVGAALLASARLFGVIKWAGAAYLIWLGLHMVVSRADSVTPAKAADDDESTRTVTTRGSSFVKGFVVQGANPKALVFFTALLPQFIEPGGSVPQQVAILGVTSVLIELLVLVFYSAAAVRARRHAGTRFAAVAEQIGGGFLIAAGARLAAVRPGP